MNAQQLKNSILQEAIEGRLAPQNPNDEPASVLLEKIRKEKARLVKEKKIKKSALKEEPITDDEKFFSIPTTWVWCKLGWIGDWGAGATPAKGTPEFYTNGTIPWLRTGELNNGVVTDSEIKVTPYALQKCSLRECKVGDVLIAMYGATIGKVAVAGIELTTNQACCACTPYQLYNKYLLYYLMASKQRFIDMGEGGAQPNISREKIVSFPFPLPPLAEQHRIVAKIEELMPKVEEYGKAQDALDKLNAELPERLKKSILQEAIEGRLVLQDPNDEPASVLLDKIRKEKAKLVKEGKLKKKDLEVVPIGEDEKPFEIPKSWEWVRLEDITTYISRGKSPVYSEMKQYPIVAQKCNQWSGFSLEKAKFADPKTVDRYSEERLLQDGDLLWNSTGLGTLGRMAIYNSNVNEYGWAVADSHVTVIRTTPNFAHYKYLYYYFASPEVQNVIEDKSDGSTKQKELAQETVRKYEIPLPPLSEQHRIVAKIEQLMSKIEKLKT